MKQTNNEMSFEETRLAAEHLFQAIVVERASEEVHRYSKDENFKSLTEEQKRFFVKCINDSIFEGVRHCLFLFDGKTDLSNGEEMEATITMLGKQTFSISEHFSSIGEECGIKTHEQT